MTIGLSLSLTLGAGLYADGGPVVLKQQFVAAWGRTEVFVANATPWEIARERAWIAGGDAISTRRTRGPFCPQLSA